MLIGVINKDRIVLINIKLFWTADVALLYLINKKKILNKIMIIILNEWKIFKLTKCNMSLEVKTEAWRTLIFTYIMIWIKIIRSYKIIYIYIR